jgi:hypothetical protein
VIARPGWGSIAALSLMIVVASLCARWSTHAQQRMSAPDMARFEQVRSEKLLIYKMGCDEWYHSARVNLCLFGAADAEHTAVAIGDSVGLQWFPAYHELFVRPGWRLLVATKSSCPMVDESLFYARIGREYTECARWRSDVLREVSSLHPNVVLVGSSQMAPYSQAQWTEGTARILYPLAKSSDHVYLMRSTPVLPFDGPSCLEPRSRLYDALSVHRECVAAARNARSDAIYQWLGNAASRFDNVSLVDMTDAICPHERCYAERDGAIVFRDDQHLSAAFVHSLAGVLADRLVQSAQDRETKGVSLMPQSSP